MSYARGNRDDMRSIQAEVDADAGLPIRGRHIGGGRHVTIPSEPPGPGWSVHVSRIREHPDGVQYATRVPEGSAEAIAERLHGTAAQAVRARGELPADWHGEQAARRGRQ